MTAPLKSLNRRVLARIRRIREDLHKHPELGLQEHRTGAVVAEALRGMGLEEVRERVAGTGVIGLLRGARPGRTVALRADMDALPIQEETGLPYASVNEGVMHACGHDGHTACVLGTAAVLAGMRERIAGNVKFIFQPAEEGWRGGEMMVREGCLKDPDVDAIFALHGLHAIGLGQVLLYPQPAVAVLGFQIHVRGKGGHGAMPHICVDPVAIGAQIISAAQTIVSREIRPDEPVVLTFGALKAGTKGNIIPDSARIYGTIRALEMQPMKRVRRALGRVARGVAKAMRGGVTISDEHEYPPVKNDLKMLEFVRQVAEETVGPRNVLPPGEQLMGGEDFGFYLPGQGGVPGVIFFLGVETREALHTPRFDFGAAALEPGIRMLAGLALRFLDEG